MIKEVVGTAALINADAREVLARLPDASVHLVVTDPPYFIDSMGDEWDRRHIATHRTAKQLATTLPAGMKFDPDQGRRLQAFMTEIADQVMRVLKPGGFFICFSQARLYHRMGVAIEEAGFEIRDMLGWRYDGHPKAFSQDHFVKKLSVSDEEKDRILAELGGRKTPQLKPQIEPMVLAQKPKEGTFVDNWLAHKTGLIDTAQSLDDQFPGNIMAVKKPTKVEKGEFNTHPTVKPVPLIEHLVRLFSVEGQLVLDPFMGSGSHGVAAVNAGRRFVGVERDPDYFSIATQRLKEAA